MRIEGPGLNTWRPISVSRDQIVELQLLSYLDGALVLGLLLAVACACILVGRRRFGSHSSDEVEPAAIAPEPTDDNTENPHDEGAVEKALAKKAAKNGAAKKAAVKHGDVEPAAFETAMNDEAVAQT